MSQDTGNGQDAGAAKVRPLETNKGIPPATREDNLLEWLFRLRDHQREHQRNGAWLIKGKDLPWELNRNGKMKWFLHPAIEDTSIRSLMFYMQEIPPGGRTGVQKTPGGQVIYVLQGEGYTLLDGERHDWVAEDVINIPIRANGVHVQHVNVDRHDPVVFVAADLNLVDIIGVDRGAEFEQVEPAPEWVERTQASGASEA